MIPTRWSSAVAILRRRLQAEEEERRLLRGLKMLDEDADVTPAAARGGDGEDGNTEPAFVVRWYLPKRP